MRSCSGQKEMGQKMIPEIAIQTIKKHFLTTLTGTLATSSAPHLFDGGFIENIPLPIFVMVKFMNVPQTHSF